VHEKQAAATREAAAAATTAAGANAGLIAIVRLLERFPQ